LMLKHKPKLVVQGTIDMLKMARAEKWIADDFASTLLTATRLYHILQQTLAMTISGNFNPDTAPTSMINLLVRVTQAKNFDQLEQDYTRFCEETTYIFEKTIR